MGKTKGMFRPIVFSVLRILLLSVFVFSWFSGRNLVALMAAAGLLVTFLPWFFRFFFGVHIPAEVELFLLGALYGFLLYEDLRGPYTGLWWWSILFNFGAAFVLGIIGLTIVSFMQSERMIDTSYIVLSFLTFCFAFTLGGLWEVFEFMLYVLLGYGLLSGLEDTMKDMMLNCLAGLLVSALGYLHFRLRKPGFISGRLFKLLRKNSNLFASQKLVNYDELIRQLIASGEQEHLEFKATIRKNLHTGVTDKKMEHAALKTLVAYLNTGGGTLLIGVGDKGDIVGLEEEGFSSDDKLRLYFVNLLRTHIGNSFLSYVRFQIVPFQGKTLLKVDCRKSDERVFLKWEGEEEFYVRSGPSSVRLQGNEMVDYIQRRFS